MKRQEMTAAEFRAVAAPRGRKRRLPAAGSTLTAREYTEAQRAGCQVIELPWPPSVNHYYRYSHDGVFLRSRGRQYRNAVAQLVVAARLKAMWDARLSVFVEVFPPDRRARDLDNTLKGLLDSIQHAGVFKSDAQIDDLHIVRREVVPAGKIRVKIEAIG